MKEHIKLLIPEMFKRPEMFSQNLGSFEDQIILLLDLYGIEHNLKIFDFKTNYIKSVKKINKEFNIDSCASLASIVKEEIHKKWFYDTLNGLCNDWFEYCEIQGRLK